jgi:DHA1 family tetracycline resistance protein-like MFS transporter
MSLFMACWFFGAPYLGDLSDAIGRKKSLMIALVGNFMGYLISAVGVCLHSMTGLVIGRMIAGFTSGSQSIAQAAIIDLSPADMKTRNLGLILFASSLGFIVGPMCGAFLSDSRIYHGFGLVTPLYFAAAIAFLNILFLLGLFKETFEAKQKIHYQLHRAINIFISAFKHRDIRYLAVVLLFMMLGWGSYYSFISMFLMKKFHFDNTHVNLFMTLLAVGFGFGFGFIVNYFSHHFSLKPACMTFLSMGGVIIVTAALLPAAIYSWIAAFLIGVCIAVAYSMILTLFSNQVDENSQGWMMGITNAIGAVGFATVGITSGLLADYSVNYPILFAGIFLILSGISLYYCRNKIK